MSMQILVKNAKVVNEGEVKQQDVFIKDGRINKISQDNNNVIEQNFQKNTEKMNLDKAENNTDVELAKSD